MQLPLQSDLDGIRRSGGSPVSLSAVLPNLSRNSILPFRARSHRPNVQKEPRWRACRFAPAHSAVAAAGAALELPRPGLSPADRAAASLKAPPASVCRIAVRASADSL